MTSSPMLQSVADIKVNNKKIRETPGVYWFWFREECVSKFLSKLSDIEYSRIPNKEIPLNTISGGEQYYALYVGKSNKLNTRIRSHLSEWESTDSLQKVVGGLLSNGALLTTKEITNFLCENCILEWEYTETEAAAKAKETQEIKSAYYPLNQAENDFALSENKRIITQVRKKYKKR